MKVNCKNKFFQQNINKMLTGFGSMTKILLCSKIFQHHKKIYH